MTTEYTINKLTPEQEAEIGIWKERWLKIGRSCKRTNKKMMTASINALYKNLGLDSPTIVFCRNPREMVISSLVMRGLDPEDKKLYNESLNDAWFIQWWSGWRVFYLFCQEVLGIKYDPADSEKLMVWIDLCKYVHAFLAFNTHCFVSDYPYFLSWNDRNRLHSTNGPALAYHGGVFIHAIDGIKYKTEESFIAAGGKNYDSTVPDMDLTGVEFYTSKLSLAISPGSSISSPPFAPPFSPIEGLQEGFCFIPFSHYNPIWVLIQRFYE